MAAEAFPTEARLVAGRDGGPASLHLPREGTPLCLATPCPQDFLLSLQIACDYSKSLSTGAVRVGKIKFGARWGGNPLSSPLAFPSAGTAALPGSCWALSMAGKSSSK